MTLDGIETMSDADFTREVEGDLRFGNAGTVFHRRVVERLLKMAANVPARKADQCWRVLSFAKSAEPGGGFMRCVLPTGHDGSHAFYRDDVQFILDRDDT